MTHKSKAPKVGDDGTTGTTGTTGTPGTTDHELLEMAAKAMQASRDRDFANFSMSDHAVCLELGCRRGAITSYWNPLTEDGDALRLAVALQIDVKQYGDHVVAWFDGGFIGTGRIAYDGDPCAATRRAIVIAAAYIGRES